MFLGHYATALVPYGLKSREEKKPFWVLLLASQFLDLLMLGLVAIGLEWIEPHNFFHSTYATMRTDMRFSHDIVPVLFWACLFSGVVLAVFKDRWLALWSAALILFHEICDLVVGFEHNVWGHGTQSVGLDLYQHAPVWGLVMEAILCTLCVVVFAHFRKGAGRPLKAKFVAILLLILVGGTLATMPLCHNSLSSFFPALK